MNPQLIPRAPKRKKQPTAEMMREQLRLAADEIIRLRTPWYRRLFRNKTTAAEQAALERV